MTKIGPALLLAVAAVAAGTAFTARAQDAQGVHYVDKLQYDNEGVYYSSIVLFWKDPGSNRNEKLTCEHLAADGHDPCVLSNSDSTRIDLDKPDKRNLKEVADGAEVWLVVHIDGGDTESCRKPNAKFYYKKGSKTKAEFTTSGTTKNNNLCHFRGES